RAAQRVVGVMAVVALLGVAEPRPGFVGRYVHAVDVRVVLVPASPVFPRGVQDAEDPGVGLGGLRGKRDHPIVVFGLEIGNRGRTRTAVDVLIVNVKIGPVVNVLGRRQLAAGVPGWLVDLGNDQCRRGG